MQEHMPLFIKKVPFSQIPHLKSFILSLPFSSFIFHLLSLHYPYSPTTFPLTCNGCSMDAEWMLNGCSMGAHYDLTTI